MKKVVCSVASALLLGCLGGAVLAETIDTGKTPFFDQANNGVRASEKAYEDAKSPKALAINENGKIYWWSNQASDSEASRRALEGCEFNNKSPCVLAIVNDSVQSVDRSRAPVSAFAEIGTEFNVTKIPFLTAKGREGVAGQIGEAERSSHKRPSIAVVIHPRGGYFVYWYSGRPGTDQAMANSQALDACTHFTPPNQFWRPADCFLYAESNKVVAKLPPP